MPPTSVGPNRTIGPNDRAPKDSARQANRTLNGPFQAAQSPMAINKTRVSGIAQGFDTCIDGAQATERAKTLTRAKPLLGIVPWKMAWENRYAALTTASVPVDSE